MPATMHVPDHLSLNDKADLAIKALADANADTARPEVMVRGNELVRMTERGELEALPTDSLWKLVTKHVRIEREGRNGNTTVSDPPRQLAAVIHAADSGEYVGVPRVERVVDVPVLGPDGHLITEPGLHPEGRIFYRPDASLEGLTVPAPDDLTTDDIDGALEVLADYLHDFGFVGDADRAHALGLMILPFVRDFIPGPTPLHVVLAPDYGSGKTWLAQAALYPGCGLVPATPQTKSEEEWRKRITAHLLAGSSAVLLDNLSGSLDSPALASALTTGLWKDRVLGESKEVTLPVRNAWAATGNNLDLAPEQVRRAVPIFLDPGDVRPADRRREDFRHPDLLGYAKKNRKELVRAVLVLIQHWRAGQVEEVEGGYVFRRGDEPRSGQKTLGSYERWADVIHGILEEAGVEGFLENRDKLLARTDPDTVQWLDFLAAWYRVHPEPISHQDLAHLCSFGQELQQYLPKELAQVHPDQLPARLPYALRKRRDSRVGGAGGFQLLRDDESRTWWPRPVPTASQP